MNFERSHLDFASLWRFGFRVGDRARFFGWIRSNLPVRTSAARLLRHLSLKFDTRLCRQSLFTFASISIRLVTVIQTLQVSVDTYPFRRNINTHETSLHLLKENGA